MGNTSSSTSSSLVSRRRHQSHHSSKHHRPHRHRHHHEHHKGTSASSSSATTTASSSTTHGSHGSSASSTASTHSSSSSIASLDDSQYQVLKMDSVVPDDAPLALRVARQWVQAKNEHNLEAVSRLTHPDFMVWLDHETQLPIYEMTEALGDMYEAFPDITFRWHSMRLIAATDHDSIDKTADDHALDRHPHWSKVVIRNYQGSGHHTGKPFGFGPYEPIASQGTFIQDPPHLDLVLYIQDDKVIQANVHGVKNALVGPPLFYTQIGGLIL